MNWMWHSEGTTDALGRLEPAMQGLQRQGTHHLLRSLPWRCALQGWSNIHSQQDAAEFISHLLGYSQPAAYSGSWEARTTYEDPNRHASIVDTGQLLSPLILEISGPTLQHCVFHWHIQNHLHALRRSPRLLFLQIKRFRRTEAGDDTVKDTTALHIKAAEVVRIPCFVNDVDASTVIEHYAVMGFIFHIGSTLKAGHYKAALSGQGAALDSSPMFYVTDDDRPLQSAQQSETLAAQGCYVIGLRKLNRQS